MPKLIIEASGLVKHYTIDGRLIEVLRGIDLRLSGGEVVAVVGPSGAGKSTLLHLIGLLEAPTGGQLMLGGADAARLTERERARYRLERIGFVFQFHHLLPEFTSLENVILPGLIRGLPRSECEGRARELLGQVGLAERTIHKPGELSGGEQQRVAFARALMNKPDLILADEPTGNLDRQASSHLRDLLWSICRERGTTLLLVTHNETLSSGADRMLRMVDGRITDVSDIT